MWRTIVIGALTGSIWFLKTLALLILISGDWLRGGLNAESIPFIMRDLLLGCGLGGGIGVLLAWFGGNNLPGWLIGSVAGALVFTIGLAVFISDQNPPLYRYLAIALVGVLVGVIIGSVVGFLADAIIFRNR